MLHQQELMSMKVWHLNRLWQTTPCRKSGQVRGKPDALHCGTAYANGASGRADSLQPIPSEFIVQPVVSLNAWPSRLVTGPTLWARHALPPTRPSGTAPLPAAPVATTRSNLIGAGHFLAVWGYFPSSLSSFWPPFASPPIGREVPPRRPNPALSSYSLPVDHPADTHLTADTQGRYIYLYILYIYYVIVQRYTKVCMYLSMYILYY